MISMNQLVGIWFTRLILIFYSLPISPLELVDLEKTLVLGYGLQMFSSILFCQE